MISDIFLFDINIVLSSGVFKLIVLLIGSIWAYHEFSTRENKAGLSVNLEQIKHTVNQNNGYDINVILNVKNVGNRQLGLMLNDTYLKVYQINKDNALINEISLIKIDKGRSSHISNSKEMRIRPNVNNNFSYLVNVKHSGNYLIEFSVKSDLDKYRSNLSYFIAKIFRQPTKFLNKILKLFKFKKRIPDRDVRFIIWKENAYYNIN